MRAERFGTMLNRLLLLGGAVAIFITLPIRTLGQNQPRGPAIVPRGQCNPSIHEGSGSANAGLKPQVFPQLGLVPASYAWNIGNAIGSIFQPGAIDPTYLGQKTDQLVGYDFAGQIGYKRGASRLYAGFKKIGGKDVTDTPRLGTPGGQCPEDPYWVAFPRPGNIENPPPFQTLHYTWDCFCRYDESVACPTGFPPPLGFPIFIPGPNLHRVYGGVADFIPCSTCFATYNIRKHDFFVGTKHPPHLGYPASFADDTGYQECLRQSVESSAGSGPGGSPQVPHLYGL
jgi:hypothetical protein